MNRSRLLLGVLAPLALAVSAGAEDAVAPDAKAPAEIVGAPASPAAAPHATPSRVKHTVALGPEGTDDQGHPGRVHTVVRGDTLWDISEAYLGTPWVWPSIWKKNPKVANPNRIYPGDRLWIAPGEMRQLSEAEANAFTHAEPQPPASTGDVSPTPMRMEPVPFMDSVGFVAPGVLETAGVVLGSPEEEKWLSAERRAYVSLGDGQAQKGDRFDIVRENEKVRDPETRRVLGIHVDKLGWLEVTKVGPESSEAMIRASYGEMKQGDRLIPHVAPVTEVPVHAGGPIEGVIAMQPEGRKITGHFDIVYLNRGTDQGLEVGNPLEVYRPGSVVRDDETRMQHRLPDDVVANLLVIKAEPESAVALVTHTNVEIARGDLFRAAADEKSSFATPSAAPLDATQWTARTIDASKSAPQKSAASPAKLAPAKHH